MVKRSFFSSVFEREQRGDFLFLYFFICLNNDFSVKMKANAQNNSPSMDKR